MTKYDEIGSDTRSAQKMTDIIFYKMDDREGWLRTDESMCVVGDLLGEWAYMVKFCVK